MKIISTEIVQYWYFWNLFYPLYFLISPEYCHIMAGDYEEGELNNNRDDRREGSRSSQVDRKRVRNIIFLNQRNPSFPVQVYTNGFVVVAF